MKGLMQWLQNNPMAVLIMFILTVLSCTMTIILGWKTFYRDYLSKAITIPVWLLILLVIVGCILVVQFTGRQSTDLVVKELESIEGKSFGVQQIVADGKKFERCYFDGTEVIFEGKAGFTLIGNKFINTKITFGRYASNTIIMLTKLYQDLGSRPIIEKLFEDIRTGNLPQSIPVKSLNQ